MHEGMRFRVDNPAPAVLRILAEFRLGHDAQYRGEIERLFDNRGYRRLYYKRAGLTVDGLGELMYDRGIVAERPSPREVLDYLDDLLRRTPRKPGRKRATADSIEAMEQHARKTRLRLFECSCGQKARGTRSSALICGICYETTGEVRPMRRIDPLPEEILSQSFATMELESAA